MHRSRRSAAAIGLIAALTSACGSGDDATTASPATPVATIAPTSAPAVPSTSVEAPAPTSDTPEALAFIANLVGGGSLDLGTMAGKPTVFWFWAPT